MGRNMSLTDEERRRGVGVFNLMDMDGGGTVDIDEICIVHDSDREQMLKILDADGNNEVSDDEWLNYLAVKKKEKGKKKFGYFMNYLEQEVPKNLDKLAESRANAPKKAAQSDAAPQGAAPVPSGSRVLKDE